MSKAPEDSGSALPFNPTELVEANQKLVLATMRAQAAEEQLLQAARHKDEFLAMLGHELRNPLVPIRNAAEVLQRIASDDPRVTWVYDVLVRQVGHVTRLVDDLLDISLISRGAMQLSLQPVDVCAAIKRAVETAEPLLRRKRHSFQCELPSKPLCVEGDEIRLTQVFDNLLINAAKYTQDRGEITITAERINQSAVIRVRDNGPGISADLQPRIFELFVQDPRAADRSEGGLGIGLALVRHLVDLHRGAIEVTSKPGGKGAEFVVSLPLLPEVKHSGRQALRPLESATGRVLIVDDDVEGGESMAVLLRLYGFEVRLATDLESALELGRAFLPQAVLMDISMPGADGYEVARQLSALPETDLAVTYIAITGFGQPMDFQRSKDAGFAHHFVKPVNPRELEQVLSQTLAGQAASS